MAFFKKTEGSGNGPPYWSEGSLISQVDCLDRIQERRLGCSTFELSGFREDECKRQSRTLEEALLIATDELRGYNGLQELCEGLDERAAVRGCWRIALHQSVYCQYCGRKPS